jgi:phage protein D
MAIDQKTIRKSKPQATPAKETVKVPGRIENHAQGDAKAWAKLHAKNAEKITGSLSLPGNAKLVAGVCIELTGFGQFSGKWFIVSSTHEVSRDSGYTTSSEIRKVVS